MSEKMRRESVGEAGCRLILLNFRNREISYFCKYRSPEATLNGIISFRFPVKPVAKNGVGVDEKASFHSGRGGLPCTGASAYCLVVLTWLFLPSLKVSVPQSVPWCPSHRGSLRRPETQPEPAKLCQGSQDTCQLVIFYS